MARQGGTGRIYWRLREIMGTLWVRVAAFAVLGLITAGLGFVLRDQIPDSLAGQIGADAIEAILQIIASSMLTVTTFSLSILTAAYATASSGSTPRAVYLLVRDGVSQTVLATFMGAFVFSLVGLIMLKTGLYGDGGRVVLFVVMLFVIVVVILSLLRWINRLGELGLIGDNLSRIRSATAEALSNRLESPWMGANPLHGPPPDDSIAIMSPKVGHIQNCDMKALAALADDAELILFITATPGDFVHPAQALVHAVNMPQDVEKAQALRDDLINCFTLRPQRSFDQDPRFGFLVLSEMGQRALSPAVNDPGTAIAVVQAILSVLSSWTSIARPDVVFPRLFIRSITTGEILRESLLPLSRDGASAAELHRSLQHCLLALTKISPIVYADAAKCLSSCFLEHANQGIVLEIEKQDLAEISANVLQESGSVVLHRTRDNL